MTLTAEGLYVVDRPMHWPIRHFRIGWRTAWWDPEQWTFEAIDYPQIRDANEHDGQWPAFITLPHETVAWALQDRIVAVPVFEGDVERRQWEQARAQGR